MINIGSREKTTDFSESGPFGKKSLTLSSIFIYIIINHDSVIIRRFVRIYKVVCVTHE